MYVSKNQSVDGGGVEGLGDIDGNDAVEEDELTISSVSAGIWKSLTRCRLLAGVSEAGNILSGSIRDSSFSRIVLGETSFIRLRSLVMFLINDAFVSRSTPLGHLLLCITRTEEAECVDAPVHVVPSLDDLCLDSIIRLSAIVFSAVVHSFNLFLEAESLTAAKSSGCRICRPSMLSIVDCNPSMVFAISLLMTASSPSR